VMIPSRSSHSDLEPLEKGRREGGWSSFFGSFYPKISPRTSEQKRPGGSFERLYPCLFTDRCQQLHLARDALTRWEQPDSNTGTS
jgi:hypothetical protein